MNNFRDYVDDPHLVLQHLPPPFQTVANYIPHLVRWLINYLISPTVYHFRSLGFQLTRLAHTPLQELQVQDLAFPLLSLVLIYFAVTSALRTARYAFSLSAWLLKWGTIIGVVAIAWAWYSGDGVGVSGSYGFGKGRSTRPSLVDHAWRFVNGEQQREWLGADGGGFEWSSWVGDWFGADGRGGYWVEVVDGLGAENVRKAAEDWWEEQINSKPKGKGKTKPGHKRGMKKEKKEKDGKNSRVR